MMSRQATASMMLLRPLHCNKIPLNKVHFPTEPDLLQQQKWMGFDETLTFGPKEGSARASLEDEFSRKLCIGELPTKPPMPRNTLKSPRYFLGVVILVGFRRHAILQTPRIGLIEGSHQQRGSEASVSGIRWRSVLISLAAAVPGAGASG